MKIDTRTVGATWLLCAAAGVATLPTQAHAAFTPFTSVEVTVDDDELTTFERKTASDFAQVSYSGLLAKGRASFGETGSFASANGQPSNYGAYAETGWSDAFTIVGGTGSSTLSVSARVQGTLVGSGSPGGPGPNSIYALFYSDSPITLGQEGGDGLLGFLDNGTAPPDGSTMAIGLFESIDGSRVFTAEIPFTYGKTLYIASYLGAEVLGDGVADFFGSAYFGATAPGGISATGASGTTYALASAVPEPASCAVMIAGLLVLVSVVRSRQKTGAE